MTLTSDQLACLLAFGPLAAGSLVLAAAHIIIEIHTQRAVAPVQKDRRHV